MKNSAVLSQMKIGRMVRQRAVWVSLLILAALIATTIQGVWATVQSTRADLSAVAAEVSGLVDQWMARMLNELQATGDALATGSNAAMLFQRVMDRSGVGLLELLWVQPGGAVIVAQQQPGRPAKTLVPDQPWLDKVSAGEHYIGPVSYEGEENGVPSVDIAWPVKDKAGTFNGTLVAQLDLTVLWDAIAPANVDEQVGVYITDDAGRLLFYRGSIATSEPTSVTLQQIIESDRLLYRGYSGETALGAAAVLEDVSWYVVAEQSTFEALRPFLQRSIVTLFFLAALGGVIVSSGYFVQRQIIAPLRMLQVGVSAFSAGDLDYRIEVDASGDLPALAGTLNELAAQFQSTINMLERRVDERTRGLLAAAEVSRSTTSMLDPDVLLRQTVMLVQDRFNFYYVGLFLLDEAGEYAVLRAGTGEAGEQMMAHGHRLKVGGQTMIGQCMETGRARIALDVGAEAARFDNPLLPDTRSEMALPLRAQRRVIGAMTVQSEKESAFDEASILVMQTMADQVAVAIDNARLYARTQAALQEMELIQQRYLGEAWTEFLRQRTVVGYERTKEGLTALGREKLPGVEQAIKDKTTVIQSDGEDTAELRVVVPIVFRDRPMGALGFKVDEERPWSDEQLALVEAIAEQFGQAAENLRLVDATQRLAAREHIVSEISSRIRATLDLETVLQTAAVEIRQALDVPELSVRLMMQTFDQGVEAAEDAE